MAIVNICTECHGTGYIGIDTDDPQDCPYCNGKGIRAEHKCKNCGSSRDCEDI